MDCKTLDAEGEVWLELNTIKYLQIDVPERMKGSQTLCSQLKWSPSNMGGIKKRSSTNKQWTG